MEPQGLRERVEQLRSAADGAARLSQTVYLSFLGLGTYIAVIIGSTTDVQLLKVSPVTLPLLNVQLPIVGFYVVVPWLLLLFYFNLLLHLTFLAQRLHRFNAVLAAFPEEATREEQRLRLFPFPFSAMLIGHSTRWRLRILLGLIVWTTVLLLPLMLLLGTQVRFLPYHDTAITWNHRVAVLVDLALLWLFWPLMLMPGQGGAPSAQTITRWRAEQQAARRLARTRRLRWGTGLLCVTLVTVVFSLGIAVLPEEGLEGQIVSIASWLPGDLVHTDFLRAPTRVFTLTFWLFERPGAPFHRNLQLREQVLVAGDPAAEVVAALRSGDKTKRAPGLDKITGLILTNRDLRGADLARTIFPKADLRGANLQGGAVLAFAQLREAHLGSAQLQGANLENAQLQGGNLASAQLQGADLWLAQLQGADLRGANIGSADFSNANLTWSDLRGLVQSPLDKKPYEGLEKRLTDALCDTGTRAVSLKRLQDAVGRPTNLSAAHANERSVLCDDVTVFRFCVPPVQSAGYADGRARFLVNLGCKGQDAARIAHGIVSWYSDPLRRTPLDMKDPLPMALAKHVTASREKDCPGWAALSVDDKDVLRKLAVGENPVPK
jgi:hypothetical protein